jgi:hypothetical protein
MTTVLTTTTTTVGLPNAFAYMRQELVSRLFTPSACAYGSEGLALESFRCAERDGGPVATYVVSSLQAVLLGGRAPIVSCLCTRNL